MNALARAAAVAGSFTAAAAVVVAVVLPVNHATPASAVAAGVSTGSAAVSGGSGGTGAGQSGGSEAGSGSQPAAGGGQPTTAGAAASSGAGTGSAETSGTSGSAGNGSGGPGSGGPGSGGTGSGRTGSGGTGSGGTGSGSTGGAGPIHPIIGSFPHMIIPVVTAIPGPTGTIGDPGVPCLQGYVWRDAYSGDYVCASPATRSQAAADNAAALSRVQPGGGAYGQYTCVQGYVWRQVVPDDYTCVTPAVRAQAAYDNSEVDNRVARLSLWMSDWTPPAQPTQNCSGDVCSTTEGGSDGPNFQINGDHFNFGPGPARDTQ